MCTVDATVVCAAFGRKLQAQAVQYLAASDNQEVWVPHLPMHVTTTLIYFWTSAPCMCKPLVQCLARYHEHAPGVLVIGDVLHTHDRQLFNNMICIICHVIITGSTGADLSYQRSSTSDSDSEALGRAWQPA